MIKYYNWLEHLSENVQKNMFALMSEQALADGEALFHIGDPSNELYQVVSGKIKCNMYSHDGKEVVISTIMPGETFGEQSLIDNLPRATNIYSVGNSVVKVLSKKHFSELCIAHPEINAQLLVMFSHRMRMAFEINTDNLTLPLSQRLTRCLYRIALSNGGSNNPNEVVHIDLSHEELARMVGASRQSVSKALKH